MQTTVLSPECEHIRALLLRSPDTEPDASLLQRIAEHLATCPHCQAAEADVTTLMAQYRLHEPPLPAHLEARLLDCMCGGQKHGEGQ
ncbi:MAG: zf-HC2 domain-containing protein [Anaerolineae bacterium]|nr:zf-HC2 domain-containing protein [Anaerolineae bacterium]